VPFAVSYAFKAISKTSSGLTVLTGPNFSSEFVLQSGSPPEFLDL
jgi:hypothetical protein